MPFQTGGFQDRCSTAERHRHKQGNPDSNRRLRRQRPPCCQLHHSPIKQVPGESNPLICLRFWRPPCCHCTRDPCYLFFMTQKRRLHSRFHVPLCKRRLSAVLIDMRHIWFKSYPANDDVHDKETGSSDSATS